MAIRKKNRPKLPRLFVGLTALLLVAVICSLLADFYWFFELFSHFVPQYALASLLLFVTLLISKRRVWAVVALAIFAGQAYKMAPMFNKNLGEIAEFERYDSVNVLQYNVHRGNKNVEQMTRWIISMSEDVDIVVLLEVTERWDEALKRIRWAYPYHIKKELRGDRSMAVFSRLYIDELEIKNIGEDKVPMVVMRGETTGYEVPFVLYGIHPPPPILPNYAMRRNNILMSAAKNMAMESAKYKMIVADFNTTRFSPWFKKMVKKSGLRDSNEGVGLISTWPRFVPEPFGIAIDNILISDSIKVEKKETGPAMGSDHFPIITSLKFMIEE